MKLIKTFGLLYFAIICISCSNNSAKTTMQGWDLAEKILDSIHQPVFPEKYFHITDYGAVNDGKTDCTQPINNAIKECTEKGGGIVVVPGGTFLTGAIHMENNVNLHISEGAVLLFSPDKSKYLPVVHTRFEGMECMNYSPFIYAYKKKNIAITGKGTLNGQGNTWWNWKGKWDGLIDHDYGQGMDNQSEDSDNLRKMVDEGTPLQERIFGEGHFLRPNFIQLFECKNLLIENISIKNSPMWAIHPVLSENITIRGVRIESFGPNNDGCDPECSKNILIENCYFNTGDDCIVVKSGRNNDGIRFGIPSQNIIIKNCHMAEGHGGVVIGSEVSGNVRNIFAEDCIMNSPNLERAIRIKSNSKRGGIIENIYVRNITVKQVKEAVLKINLFYDVERDNNIPVVRNIYLENIESFNSIYGIWIKAYQEKPVENLNLINCSFKNVKKGNIIENVNNVNLENLKINDNPISGF